MAADIYERIAELRKQGLRFGAIGNIIAAEYGGTDSADRVRGLYRRWKERGGAPPMTPSEAGLKAHEQDGERKAEMAADEAPADPTTYEERVERAKERESKRFDQAAFQRLLKDKARTELMCDVLERAVQRIPAPTIILVRPKFDPSLPTVEAVALSSDWHAGQEILAEETGGLGEYNLDIFHERELQWQNDMLEYLWRQRQICNIPRVHFFHVGDLVDGDGIYRGHKDHIEVDPTEQVFAAMAAFSATHVEFQNDYDVECWGKMGNHGRIGAPGENKTHVNWDYLAYRFMEIETRHQSKITWHIDKAWWSIAEVLGWRFLLMHGEDIKAWNSLPHYGIDRTFSRYGQLGLEFDYMAIGHFHQMGEFDAPKGEKIVNGAAPGPSFYSLKVLQSGSRPSQLLFGVTAEQGLYWRHTVYLDDVQPRRRMA